jgi:hypothetical protein
VVTVIATGVNADGHREILGLDVVTSEDGAGWSEFLRGLVARGEPPRLFRRVYYLSPATATGAS